MIAHASDITGPEIFPRHQATVTASVGKLILPAEHAVDAGLAGFLGGGQAGIPVRAGGAGKIARIRRLRFVDYTVAEGTEAFHHGLADTVVDSVLVIITKTGSVCEQHPQAAIRVRAGGELGRVKTAVFVETPNPSCDRRGIGRRLRHAGQGQQDGDKEAATPALQTNVDEGHGAPVRSADIGSAQVRPGIHAIP